MFGPVTLEGRYVRLAPKPFLEVQLVVLPHRPRVRPVHAHDVVAVGDPVTIRDLIVADVGDERPGPTLRRPTQHRHLRCPSRPRILAFPRRRVHRTSAACYRLRRTATKGMVSKR